ncbi:MAG: tyrosine-type recombinase/integrase [Phycisphaerales bacterium]|nr:tyrosine-type recombinase/integrase [Phycisphaerales bacterium]
MHIYRQMLRYFVKCSKPTDKVSNDNTVAATKEWLEYIQAQRTGGTYRTYVSCVNNLKKYLDTRPSLRCLEQFNVTEALRYRDWLLKGKNRKKVKANQKKTADNNLVILWAFFNFCVSMRKMRANPIHEQPTGVQLFFNEKKPQIETYTRREYAGIIQHAPTDLSRKCRLLGASGLRIDELAHLEFSDIDRRRGWLHVRTKVTHDGIRWTPKDKTDRKLPLNAELRAVIDELIAEAGGESVGYIFPGRPGPYRAKNLARSTLLELKSLAAITGIPAKKLTSHNFRRYFVSQCADCGIDILCVMEWVGHDDWEMVRRYYRLRDQHAQEAMHRFTTGSPEQNGETQGHHTSFSDPERPFGEYLGNAPEHEKREGQKQRAQATKTKGLALCGAE